MKLMSFRRPDASPSWGIVKGEGVIDLGACAPGLKHALWAPTALAEEAVRPADYALDQVRFLPPIPDPDKILCVGLNYLTHIKEGGREPPPKPIIFARFSNSQVGHGASLVRPSVSETYDYEGELAVVIARRCRHVAPDQVASVIAGYACYNEGSVREWQRHSAQFTPGKNFFHSGAFGPWLVTPEEAGDITRAHLITRLNGAEVQHATIDDLCFDIPTLIAYVSTFTQLEAGDVIVTGTTGGVGAYRKPPLWMQPGDTVEVEISGVGLLRNKVVAERPMLETIPWGTDLAATVAEFGDAEAVHDGSRGIGLGALAGRAARLALLLRDAGVTPGACVGLSLPNGIPAVWASNALRLAGAAEVGLNAGLTAAERRYCLDLSATKLVVTSADQAAAFHDLGCAVIAIEAVPDAPADPAALPPVPGTAWAKVGFTSGTTGQPKAIVTTHAARWLANVLQRAHLGVMPGPGSRVLLLTPFIHGAGLIAHAFHDRGAGIVLLRGVDLPVVLALLRAGAVDHVFAPPTVLAKLAGALEGERIGGIRTIFCGTAPLLPALYAKARAIFGPVVRVTYGKSEIVNPITVLPPAATDAYYGEPTGEGVCVGWPGAGVEIEIRNETGGVLASDAVGEVHLRGRHMSSGHVDARGFQPLPDDGFHATGDLGRIDARGRLHLVGRLADVVKSGGYKIHPDEIERELAGTAGPAAVAIVSLPSEYWGEIIVAVAETDDAGWPDRARAALAGLARYKHPRAFLLLGELPRNPQGKIMRRLIRAALLDRYRIIDGSHPQLEPR